MTEGEIFIFKAVEDAKYITRDRTDPRKVIFWRHKPSVDIFDGKMCYTCSTRNKFLGYLPAKVFPSMKLDTIVSKEEI